MPAPQSLGTWELKKNPMNANMPVEKDLATASAHDDGLPHFFLGQIQWAIVFPKLLRRAFVQGRTSVSTAIVFPVYHSLPKARPFLLGKSVCTRLSR